ncbi:MAG: UPF0182 family protein [Acidimicrobiia bacterium]|nr:UPF0182 family protein [Acidimicrobiia bacterium]
MIDRESTPIRPRGGRFGRRALFIALGAFVVLLLSLRSIATFWTDFLWFDSVDLAAVWRTLIFSRVILVIVASVAAFGILLLNLWVADRLSPRTPLTTGSPDEEIVERFQEWIEPRVGRMRLAVAGFFGLLIGLGAGTWWENYLLFTNRESFGITDPEFGRDIGFYVFQVPFLRDLFGWTFQLVIISTLIVAAVHYLNGGIQIGPRRQTVGGGVKVHVSVLLAILALLKAAGYWLDQFDLLYSTRGAVFGATYTDVNAQLPALRLLIFISIFAGLLLLVNIRFGGWTIPAVAVGLWLVTSIALGGIWPAAVQRFSVQPDEINKELPFVERNITSTREAFGLADVEVRDFSAAADLDAQGIVDNRPTIDNVRLWDPSVLLTTYRQLQELRPFYQFEDVDVDRYTIGDDLTQVMLAARELDEGGVPSGWVNEHLVYTHGFGAVVSPANTVTVEGQPDFLVRDIRQREDDPPAVQIDQGRIYFGEAVDSGLFKIVGTEEQEVDFPIETSGAETVAFNSYDGEGGVAVGGIFRRAAFALRFADVNTLISGQIRGDSRVLMVRNIRDRVEKAAPFLKVDADPYLVVLDGRLVWVQDLYTVTDRYPYSTPAITARLSSTKSGLPNDFNYIRNSVKATIDAYDGTMNFYVVDETDPIVRTYRKIFPDLFTPGDEIPEALRDNIRYPEDLFRVQSDMYSAYHVTEPRVFFNDGDPWEIARDPSTTPSEALRATFPDSNRPMVPYYLLMTLPGEEDLSYLMLQPFTAATRPNMVSFIVAKSDPAEYGDLIDFELPRDSFVDGPGQVGARINQNPDISREFTLLGQEGSEVIQGNMLVVPIEESIVYVQPIYISARQESGSDIAALPEFKKVVVVFGDRIVMRDTLPQALAAVFGDAPPQVTDPDDPGTPTDPGDPGTDLPTDLQEAIVELLVRADAAFERADAALRDGDLAGYQQAVDEAQSFIDQAQQLVDASAEGGGA